MKIRFTRDVWLNADDRAKEPSFPEGSEHDMVETSAYRWTRRNVAVYVVEEAVAEPVKLKLNRPMMVEKRVFDPREVAKVFSADEGTKADQTFRSGRVFAPSIEQTEPAKQPAKKRGRKPKGA